MAMAQWVRDWHGQSSLIKFWISPSRTKQVFVVQTNLQDTAPVQIFGCTRPILKKVLQIGLRVVPGPNENRPYFEGIYRD